MRKKLVGVILPSVEYDWLKWSCEKYDTQRQRVMVGFRVRI